MAKYQQYEEYKEVDVEWGDSIPLHWKTASLSKLFMIKAGGDLQSALFSETKTLKHKYPIYTNANDSKAVYGYTSKPNFPSNTVTVSGRGEVGFAVYRNHEFDAIIRLLVLIPFVELDGRFFAYFINDVIDFNVQSSAIGQLSTLQISPYKVALPSYQEQSLISDYLDHETAQIDTLIEKQQTLIQLLKEKRQAVISHAVTKGLNPDAPMKDSGVEWLGEVPEHWKVAKLKFYTNQIVDGAHFTPTYTDKGIPFLRVTDIHNDSIDMNSIKYIPRHEHEALIKRCNPQKGDLLLSKNGTIGIPKVIDWEWEFSIFVSLCLIKFKETLTSHYAEYFFKSHEIKEQISGLVKQSTVINLHLDKIQNFWFAIPPVSEQHETVNVLNTKIEKFDGLIGKAEKAIQLMQERRTALISAAVTGKIDVRGWVAPE